VEQFAQDLKDKFLKCRSNDILKQDAIHMS